MCQVGGSTTHPWHPGLFYCVNNHKKTIDGKTANNTTICSIMQEFIVGICFQPT